MNEREFYNFCGVNRKEFMAFKTIFYANLLVVLSGKLKIFLQLGNLCVWRALEFIINEVKEI